MNDTNGTSGSFPKLNRTNYQNWKFNVRLLLIKEGLWNVVEDAIPAADAKTNDWKLKDGKAQAVIGLSVDTSQVNIIKNLSHAKQYWDALKEAHEKPNLSNKVFLYKKLWKCHQGNNPVECHINYSLYI